MKTGYRTYTFVLFPNFKTDYLITIPVLYYDPPIQLHFIQTSGAFCQCLVGYPRCLMVTSSITSCVASYGLSSPCCARYKGEWNLYFNRTPRLGQLCITNAELKWISHFYRNHTTSLYALPPLLMQPQTKAQIPFSSFQSTLTYIPFFIRAHFHLFGSFVHELLSYITFVNDVSLS